MSMNSSPYSHLSHHGTLFEADRGDLTGGVRVTDAPERLGAFLSDVAEFTGYHACHVLPNLNGFAGYDCIDFQFDPTGDSHPLRVLYDLFHLARERDCDDLDPETVDRARNALEAEGLVKTEEDGTILSLGW